MRHLFRASLLERIAAYSRTPRGLAVICIWWIVFLLVLVFVFTPRISWGMQLRASGHSSTAVSLLEKSLDGWTNRRLFCSALQPCDAWNPFSEDAPSSLRFEMRPEPGMVKI